MLSAVPALIFTLLAGPWSDIFGRKPLLLASIVGQLLGNLALLACSYWFDEMPSDLILISTIGYYLGGLHCFSMLAHSMLTDITDTKVRTKRIVLLGGFFRVGLLAGQTVGAAVKKTWGFVPSFAMAALFSILCFLYALIFVKDHKKTEEETDGDNKTEVKKSKCKVFSTFFDCRGLVQSFKCLFLKRSGSKRFCLLITAICFGLEEFVETGGHTYLYLYLRKILDIDLVGYAVIKNVSLIFSLLVQFVLVPILSGKFGVRDTAISMMDAATCVVQNIILALAFHIWMVYLSIFAAVLDAVSFSIIRSIVTKVGGIRCVVADFIVTSAPFIR